MMRNFAKGFLYAGRGIKTAVLEERNFRFELCAALYVFVFSLFYGFGAAEYFVLILVVAGVLSLELLNTAIERAIDLISPQKSKKAGAIKDIAAGMVLVYCVASIFIGILLFWRPTIFRQIFSFFVHFPLLFVLFLASLFFSFWFIFLFGRKGI